MCEFCGPESRTVTVDDSEGNVVPNAVWLLDRSVLAFDNSEGEYNAGMLPIKFCPFCGDKLKHSIWHVNGTKLSP